MAQSKRILMVLAHTLALAMAALATLHHGMANAQSDWPSRPVRIIVRPRLVAPLISPHALSGGIWRRRSGSRW